MSIKALGLKKTRGDNSGMSYISTGLSLALNKTKICFADIDPDTGLISLESIKNKINKNTKAIIPVNLYGQKVDIKKLRSIVGKKIFIIEDSAQSHFAFSCYNCGKQKKKPVAKNSTILTLICLVIVFIHQKPWCLWGWWIDNYNNMNFYRKLKILRNLGTVKKNVHEYEGLNSRLDNTSIYSF